MVRVSVGVMDDRRHDRPLDCGIAPELVGDQPPRFAPLTLEQPSEEAFCGAPVREWLRGPFGEYARDKLLGSRTDWFDLTVVRRLLDESAPLPPSPEAGG